MRAKTVVLSLLCLVLVPLPPAGAAHPSRQDPTRAVNVMPPGESGHIDLLRFVQGQLSGDYGPHFADQHDLYARFAYKPMTFEDPALHDFGPLGYVIRRDPFGVPRIYARDRRALMEGFGYATASDRLFQMDLFRRAGHGRLAEILGEGFVEMDAQVRTLSEGPARRAAEAAEADPQTREDLQAFAAGVNRYIAEALTDPAKLPAEFLLLADLPIEPWTPDDTLAFGEFAGRFFGEFGHAELEMAAELAALRDRYGPARAQEMFDDLYPPDDPSAPTTIPPEAGTFPRHTAPPAGPAGQDPTAWGGAAALRSLAGALTAAEARVTALRRAVGLHGFGSNQYVVAGTHTRTGRALLVSEPQTGWAVPSFFYEVELHGGGFDVRGVTVPGLPFVPIGRNAHAAWAVTSGLDANSDTFAETVDPSGTRYLHDGRWKRMEVRSERIVCRTPPTVLFSLPDASPVCRQAVRTVTVRRTVHGPLLTPPAGGVAFSRQSVVDGLVVASLEAWTRATQSQTVEEFGRAAGGIAFGFNFMVADAAGNAGYFHAGRYPLRPAGVDPRLPIPGTGPWDWQGFERYADQPHAINPPGGFLANWNNKPAAGWASKGLLFATAPEGRPVISVWGPSHQVEPIQAGLGALVPGATFEDMAEVERHASSVDNRARAWKDELIAAIDASGDGSLGTIRDLLAAWDGRRLDDDGDGRYDAAGLVIFDRWVEEVLRRTFADDLDPRTFAVSSGIGSDGTFRSADNGDAPTFKVENALFGTFGHALRGDARVDWFGPAGRDAVVVSALRAVAESLRSSQGDDPSAWREPVEVMSFAPQGAGSVPDIAPLRNRGSYGQIVEPR